MRAGRGEVAGMTIGCVGTAGGVGTTTVLLNLAFLLARPGRSVLALELATLVGSFASQLQLEACGSSADVLARPDSIDEALACAVACCRPGVELLCAPTLPDTASPSDGERFDRLVHAAARRADFVLVDLPRDLPPEHERVVRHADHLLIVLEPTERAAADLRRVVRRLHGWGVGSARISVARVDREPVEERLAGAVQATCRILGVPIAGVIPPAAEACVSAALRGLPLVVACPDRPAGTAFAELGRELVAEVEQLRLRVAIVGGAAATRSRVCALLDDADPVRFEVASFAGLDAAFPDLAAGAFDAVLLAPDDAGADVAGMVARIARAAERTAVLVLTAGQDQGGPLETLAAGAQDQLELEQLEPPWLCHAVRGAIERRRAGVRLEREMKDLVGCVAELRRMVVQILRHDSSDPRMV